jgi:hypothetical protein
VALGARYAFAGGVLPDDVAGLAVEGVDAPLVLVFVFGGEATGVRGLGGGVEIDGGGNEDEVAPDNGAGCGREGFPTRNDWWSCGEESGSFAAAVQRAA